MNKETESVESLRARIAELEEANRKLNDENRFVALYKQSWDDVHDAYVRGRRDAIREYDGSPVEGWDVT